MSCLFTYSITKASTVTCNNNCRPIPKDNQQKNIRILFIGDSVTDGGWGRSGGSSLPSEKRSKNDLNHIYGSGYMYLCATYYQGKFPERNYEFYNRGISGNTLEDMEKRWDKDVLNINPDIISILIGINDIDKFINKNDSSEFDYASWEIRYRALLNSCLSRNNDIKIILCSPFVCNSGKLLKENKFEEYNKMVEKCSSIVRNIANDYKAIFIPFNELFNNLNKESIKPNNYWIWDGIHPSPAGHYKMAELWIENFDSY